MFVRNDSARVEVKWLSSSRDSQGLFGYVTIFVRKLVILVFNTHENDGTIPRSERRDFEEWRHVGKLRRRTSHLRRQNPSFANSICDNYTPRLHLHIEVCHRDSWIRKCAHGLTFTCMRRWANFYVHAIFFVTYFII